MNGPGSGRPRILFYGMYDAASATSAPRVRIRMLARALGEIADVRLVHGSRLSRLAALPRQLWLLRQTDAVYVESPTAAVMPWDLFLLAAARAMGRPVGVYFRDAYQRFRDLYPVRGLRGRASDAAWSLTMPLLRRLATVRYAPSLGLASILRLPDPIVLPPGTDPSAPDLGPGPAPVVAYVGALSPTLGFDRLLEAMRLVRRVVPDARLLAVGAAAGSDATPAWVELRRVDRSELGEVLAPARACVIPLPLNRYTDLAWPFKLADYLSFGKPVVATATAETAAVLDGSGAGLVVEATAEALADALQRVLTDDELAARMGSAARALAQDGSMTWASRARRVVETLAEPNV